VESQTARKKKGSDLVTDHKRIADLERRVREQEIAIESLEETLRRLKERLESRELYDPDSTD